MKEPSYMGNAGRNMALAIPVLGLLAAIGAGGYLWWKSTAPTVELAGGFPRALGPSTPLRIRWANPHGARRVTVIVEQNAARSVAYEKMEPGIRFRFSRPPEAPGEAAAAVAAQQNRLTPGKAVLTVEVESNDLRGQVARVSRELPVVLEKPSVKPDSETVFLRRGGTGVVFFTVGGGWDEAGVRIGRFTFPSWPSKGRADRRFCLFSIPPELADDAEPVLYARNAIGDEATSPFPHQVKAVKFRERTLEVSSRLMDKVLSEFDNGINGTAVDRFTHFNSKMRRANDATLAELAKKSEGKKLWDGPFVMLPRGKAEAMFADHRTYKFDGQVLNNEWHLGIDMASVRNAPIPAASAGKVVFAARLGIYGNCVAIDHGLGVLTVYGHLSAIGVKVGDTVTQGQEIGKSGMTGLAGGDHLHLGVMVGGAFVDPLEWAYSFWMSELSKRLEM